MKRQRMGAIVALGLLTASACGYHMPQPKQKISMHTFTADVLYGATAAAILPGAVPLPVPAAPQPVSGGTFTPPSAPPAPTPPAVATVCSPPTSNTVKEPAIGRVLAPPVAATYPFRSTQSVTNGGATHKLTDIAETRQIANVVTSGNTINYSVISTYPFLGLTETTDYQIVTSSDVPADEEGTVPAGTLSGIYVTGQSVGQIGGKKPLNTVTWSPALQILKLPAAQNETWAVSSTDQKTGESESFTAKIDAISQVNACGTLVQGFEVVMSGALVTPGQSAPVTFDQTELISPQFGGIVVADNATVTVHTSATTSAVQQISDTINVSPKPPRSTS